MVSDIQSGHTNDLARSLRARHVQMIALGGTIGVGLFLGSAQAIQRAGPGLLIGYAIAGVAIFFIMRALGELMLHLSCPRPSGPGTMIVWITKGMTNAEQEAQAGRDHRQAA